MSNPHISTIPPKILIIEDDQTTRLMLSRMLEEQGYEIVLATDGHDGLEKALSLKPALIISDWIMPRMDGLQVCKQVKADPALSTCFFILLTARGAVEDRVIGLDSGADDFLSKPVDISEMRARVRAGLRLNRVYEDLQMQKHMLESELLEAAQYVRSLLPDPMTGEVEIDSRFVPSRQLGGDCFDYYWLDPDFLAIYLMDVSGHGLGAALPSISVMNLLRSQSIDGVNFYQPNHVLTALNETFQMDHQNDKYFTIWYGVYNRISRQLTYSSAGHPPALLVTGSDASDLLVKRLKTVSLPIGMMPDTRFSSQRCEIAPDSSLYIFSDGIYEIMQSDGDVWGIDGLTQFLIRDRHLIQIKGLDHIVNHVKTLSGQDILDDDLSLLRIQFQ